MQLQETARSGQWPPDDGCENARVHDDAAGAWMLRGAGGCTSNYGGVRDSGGEGNISDGGEGGGACKLMDSNRFYG